MSTRAKVEEAIEAIDDKGNNTAKEVREVLTRLLDYTENIPTQPSQQDIVPFSFVTNGFLKDRGATGSVLQYSCRGFKGEFANFTFFLQILNKSEGNVFTFPLYHEDTDKFIEIIDEILPTNSMRFSIPFKLYINQLAETFPNGLSYAIPTNISFLTEEDGLKVVKFDMDFTIYGLGDNNGDADYLLSNASTYTSVCFHSNQKIKEHE